MSDKKSKIIAELEFPIGIYLTNSEDPTAGIYVTHEGRYVWYYHEKCDSGQVRYRTNLGEYWGGAFTLQECLQDLIIKLFQDHTNMRSELNKYERLQKALRETLGR